MKSLISSIILLLSLISCSTPRGQITLGTISESDVKKGLNYKITDSTIEIITIPDNKVFISFPKNKSFLEAGIGEPEVKYRMAAFTFKDSVKSYCNLQTVDSMNSDGADLSISGMLKGPSCSTEYTVSFSLEKPNEVNFMVSFSDEKINRVKLYYKTNENEQFFGFGEQNTHFNFKGKEPFLFTEEQGIGRGDQPITFGANLTEGAGGNEYTSYAPIPHYITSENKSVFFENTAYSKFNLKDPNEVSVLFWENNLKGTIWLGNSPLDLIEKYTSKTGRFPMLPDWAYGTWLGLQAGEISVPAFDDKMLKGYEKLDKIIDDAEKAGNPIVSLWIQDWCGRRITGFGDQLKWRWYADEEMYPDLKSYIAKLSKKNIKVMGYINSFLADKDPTKPDEKFENPQLEEAKKKGYLVKNAKGEDYMVQTIGFPAYLIDLTNPEAVKWTKDIIKREMIDLGLSGWMADFGEWLPFDAVMHNGETGETYHNKYPVEWARINREAIKEAKKEGKIVFFTRAGYSYSAKYSTAFWEGDQMVSFGINDGLASTIVGLNAGGVSGIAVNHSDIGGYTTIGNPLMTYKRSKELFLRWTEMSAFTPIYRSHEGNKPKLNHQPYTDKETIEFFAKFGKVHYALRDYFKHLMKEANSKGYPIVRHPYLHYPNDKNTYNILHQFMLGEDLMVIPVTGKGDDSVSGYLPAGEWEHLFTGKTFKGGAIVEVEAPIGTPAVFVKKGGAWSEKIKTSVKDAIK
ncbi:MAG: alpha-glucosidase [Leptospiraceae bacterium]|nr:alpha-glucosidase [Leptospiraceae bacterium]